MSQLKEKHFYEILGDMTVLYSQNPQMAEEDRKSVEFLVQRKFTFNPDQVRVFQGLFDLMGLPIKVEPISAALGMYMGKWNEHARRIEDERIVLSSGLAQLFHNPKTYGVKKPDAEMLFVLLHELNHARFQHLFKERILQQQFRMPSSVYNIAFDIFINTLLKYNSVFVNMHADKNIMNINAFKYGCRYYSDPKELQEMAELFAKQSERLGVPLSPNELIPYNVFGEKEIEKLTDNELVELFYSLFKEFFDEYDKLMQQAMDEVAQEMSSKGEGNGIQQTSSGEGNQGEDREGDDGSKETSEPGTDNLGSAEDQGGSSSQGNPNPHSGNPNLGSPLDSLSELDEYINRVRERTLDKVKEKAGADPEFKENLRKYFANFSELPDPKTQIINEISGMDKELSPSDRVNSMRAKQYLQELIENYVQSNGKGTVPGWIRSLADIKPEKPSYLDAVRTFGKRHVGVQRRTFNPPNKKYQSGSVLLSSKISREKDLLFILDTSGSMEDEPLARVLAHVKNVVTSSGNRARIHVIFNDATVQHEVIKGNRLSKLKEIIKKGVQGGGGSVFDEAFRHPAIKKVDAVIFVSDFMIFLDEKIRLNIPTILLYTKNHDEDILRRMLKQCTPSIAVPIYKD